MDEHALQHAVQRLFERHDVELEADEEWLLTEGDFPAVRAGWQAGDGDAPGRLDLDVVLSEERRVELSYAGYGEGKAACTDALERFARGDLHVLLAACWYITDDRKLDLASWHIGVRSWDVFLGAPLVEGADVTLPPALGAAVALAVQDEVLSAELHWVRWVLRRAADGALAVEALLDNEPWPAGDRTLAALAWPEAAQAYAVRGFLMLDVRDY